MTAESRAPRIGEVIARDRLVRLYHRYCPDLYLPQAPAVIGRWSELRDWSPSALAAAFDAPPGGHEDGALARAAQAWASKIGETMAKAALKAPAEPGRRIQKK